MSACSFSNSPGKTVLRLEEFGQQAVHAQQAFAAQPDPVRLHRGESLLSELLELRRKAHTGIEAELLREVFRPDTAELHLEDELANHPLFVLRRQRAVQGQFPSAQALL